VLWARTKFAIDAFDGPLLKSAAFCVMSRHGGIGLLLSDGSSAWRYRKYPADRYANSEIELQHGYKTALWFVQYMKNSGVFRIRVPYWSLVSLSALFAVAPWLQWRFSLRTLLVAITVVAIILGVLAFNSRSVQRGPPAMSETSAIQTKVA
jgi:hypothetical protein